MGRIRELATGRELELEPEHLVGRGPTCSLRIDQRYVSAQHALLRWTARWEVKDLGSRNGTFLDGNRLTAGDELEVAKGNRLAFGKLEEHWELVDDSAPLVMAVPIDGGDPVVEDGALLALPSIDDPQATIYQGPGGNWLLDQNGEVTALVNTQMFDVAGRGWRFCCPDSARPTSVLDPAKRLQVARLELAFAVSRDEEHVELRVVAGDRTFDLGARGHHYLLLTLARRRLADAAAGLPDTTCGWIDQEELAHDPSMAPPQLNIDVFRIRKQFGTVGALDPANIVERRSRTRQLRIGTGNLVIATI